MAFFEHKLPVVALMSGFVCGATLASFCLLSGIHLNKVTKSDKLALKNRSEIRKRLPADMRTWRSPGMDGRGDEFLWAELEGFFKEHGYAYWTLAPFPMFYQTPPDDRITNNGYGYMTVQRDYLDEESPLSLMRQLDPPSPLIRGARTTAGQDVVLRVLSVGSHGRDVLEIIKDLSTSLWSVADCNHALPLLDIVDFVDITIGIFPKVGFGVSEAYGCWPKNSVGDILDMILQCLEALSFIHWIGIAHRDAFKDNFLVQFHPESLNVGRVTVTRPRVYLHDFETAVRFSLAIPVAERVCVGKPAASSFSADGNHYSRPLPTEVVPGQPYDPMKLDIWQFGTSLRDFKSTIPQVDEMLERLRSPDASTRPTASEATNTLGKIVASLPPHCLHIPPEIL